MRRYQFVWWWPEWHGVQFIRYGERWRDIYEWSLYLGFVEVRRWARRA